MGRTKEIQQDDVKGYWNGVNSNYSGLGGNMIWTIR